MSDTGDLTSEQILDAYLLKELYQLITKAQFKTLLEKIHHTTVSEELSDEIFAASCRKKNDENTKVMKHIQSLGLSKGGTDFDAPVDVNEEELKKLVSSISMLTKSVKDDITNIQRHKSNIESSIEQFAKPPTDISKLDDEDMQKLNNLLSQVKDKFIS